MLHSAATVIKALAKHDIRSAMRDDGTIMAELESPRLSDDGNSIVSDYAEWVEVPIESDALLEFLGYNDREGTFLGEARRGKEC